MGAARILGAMVLISAAAGSGPAHPETRDQPMRLRYGQDNAQLQWQMVTNSREMAGAGATAPSAVRFRALPPARVEGDDLILDGELENPDDAPAVVYLFGVNFQPLTLSVRWENGFEWRQPCPDPWCAPQPPAPPPPFRITLPPHSVVGFSGRCDLRTIGGYQGSPDATFDWRFNFHHTREAETGTLRFRLQPR